MKRLLPFLLLCGLAFSVTPPADAYQTSAAKEKKAEPKAEVPAKPLPAGPAIPVRFVPRVVRGQEIVVPPEASGDVGEPIEIPATTTGAIVVWRAIDAGLNVFPAGRLKDTKTAVVWSIKPGRYRLWAWTAVAGTATDRAECLVIVGQAPPVPPGPVPPDPTPIPPSDPLFSSLQVAFTADSTPDKATHKNRLASLYKRFGAKEIIGTFSTMGELIPALKKASLALPLEPEQIKPVRDVLAVEMKAKLPSDPDATFDKDAAGKLFARFAALLEAVK